MGEAGASPFFIPHSIFVSFSHTVIISSTILLYMKGNGRKLKGR